MTSNPTLYCYAPFDALAEFAAGDDPRYVTTEIDILELVPQEQVGGAGKFHATTERGDQMIANHAREAALGYEPPLVLGHPRHEDGAPDESAPAVGWLSGLVRKGTRLRATVRLLREFAESVKSGAYRYVSPEFTFAAHSSTGERIGAKVQRVGVTNTPHQKGADGQPVGQFQLAEVAGTGDNAMFDAEKKCADLETKLAALADEFAKFTKPKAEDAAPPAEPTEEEKVEMAAKAKLAEDAKKLPAQLAELAAAVVTLSERVTAKDGETVAALSAKDGEIKTLSESLSTLKSDNDRRDIAAEVDKGVRDGKLSPAQVEGYKADPIKWLSESQFNGIAGLRKHVLSAPTVVDTAPRLSLGAGGAKRAPGIALTEGQWKAAGYSSAEEMASVLEKHEAEYGHGDPVTDDSSDAA